MLKTMFVALLAIGIGLTWLTPVNACQCSNQKELKQVVCSMPVLAVVEYRVLDLNSTDLLYCAEVKADRSYETYSPLLYTIMEKCFIRFSQGRNFISANYLFNRNKPLKYSSPSRHVIYPLLC